MLQRWKYVHRKFECYNCLYKCLKKYNNYVSFQLYLATESPVSQLDWVATNGVVQVLDAVMIPPTKTLQGTLQESQFSTFFGMIEKTDVIAYLISSKYAVSAYY